MKKHVLELKQEEEEIYECEICGKRGKITDFYTECIVILNEKDLEGDNSPFDFLFKDYKSSFGRKDSDDPIDTP